MDDETTAYRVEERGGTYVVLDSGGRVALACADATTAERYAGTLNEAFRRGYKQGRRAARRA